MVGLLNCEWSAEVIGSFGKIGVVDEELVFDGDAGNCWKVLFWEAALETVAESSACHAAIIDGRKAWNEREDYLMKMIRNLYVLESDFLMEKMVSLFCVRTLWEAKAPSFNLMYKSKLRALAIHPKRAHKNKDSPD
jgi:hypothetical protein